MSNPVDSPLPAPAEGGRPETVAISKKARKSGMMLNVISAAAVLGGAYSPVAPSRARPEPKLGNSYTDIARREKAEAKRARKAQRRKAEATNV